MGKCLLTKNGNNGIDPDTLTATPSDVLAGKIAGVSGSDEPTTGTMPNRGAVSQTLNAGGSYTIPAGYHNGSGKVSANSLSSQTSANATASQILSGQTAWVNGSKVTGNMLNRGAVSQSLGINGTYTIPAGYHNGSGKVSQSLPVQGGSTTTPGTANKTIVAANRYVNGNIVVAGSGNLTAGNIKKGVNIFGVTGSWEGYVTSPLYLYNNGTWHSLLVNVKMQDCSAPSGIDYESSYLWYGAKADWVSMRTGVMIDVTNYNYVSFTSTNGGRGETTGISVGTNPTTYVNADSVKLTSTTNNGDQTLTLNISSVTGKVYIKIAGGGYSRKLKQLWLHN